MYEDGAPFSPLVLVVGSEMEVGKTTCAASAAVALRAAGLRITYAKLTGTGRMRDLMRVNYGRNEGFFDAMRLAWDFVDAGLATTFEIPARSCAAAPDFSSAMPPSTARSWWPSWPTRPARTAASPPPPTPGS